MKNSASYGPVAKCLHWLIALGIIGMLILGWIMIGYKGEMKFSLFQWHKSIGITILLLALFRLVWRAAHRPPAFPATMKPWEKAAAHAGHMLLYVLMIAMPLAGWVIVSTSKLNFPTMLYGLVQWPHLPLAGMEDKKEINRLAGAVHYYLAWVILVVAAGHAAAAWKHHLLDRDDILTRMAPKFATRFLNRIRGKNETG